MNSDTLLVLAQRNQTQRLVTLNLGHFRAVTPLKGGAFILLPVDG